MFRERLAALSALAVLKPTSAPGTARLLAADAVREGFETVAAAGGDGTVNEVLNGIGDVPGGFERTRLGVLPLGTINVFARELDLPKNIDDAWHVIEHGVECQIDLPQAEFTNSSQPCVRYFAQLAGVGLDSRAIELVNWEHKKRFGALAYVVAGFKALNEKRCTIAVSAPGIQSEGELILIGNGRYYGGSFVLFPRADMTDGKLDITVFPKVNWEVLFRTGLGGLINQLHLAAGCQTFQAESLTLTTREKAIMELDGENIGLLPVNLSVNRGKLKVLRAAQSAKKTYAPFRTALLCLAKSASAAMSVINRGRDRSPARFQSDEIVPCYRPSLKRAVAL